MAAIFPEPEGLRELPMGTGTLLPPLMPVEVNFHRRQSYPVTRVSQFLKVEPVSEVSESPIYYVYKRVEKDGKQYVATYYTLFYEVNPGYVPPCLPCMFFLPKSSRIGYHPADLERYVVLFDPTTLQPEWVFWGAHGSGHGQWVAWDKCLHTSDGLLRAFVSYKSHGFYPEPRTYWRAWGTINDVCGEARQWRPEAKDFTDASKQAWTQSHFQVVRGINSPYNVVDPDVRGISDWERLNLALPAVRRRIASPKIPVLERLPADGATLTPLTPPQQAKGTML